MTYEQEINSFKRITDLMCDIFAAKRHDYGPTTEETFRKFGLMSMIVRMYDKIGRLENLTKDSNKRCYVPEAIEDTLLDLANYAVIALLEIEKDRAEQVTNSISS